MEISSANQAYVFLTMILCGALCTVIFDVFRAIRRFKKSSSGVIAFQDLVFWLIELVIVYLVAFELNYAKVRAYEIIALVIGSLIYFVSLSEYVIRTLCRIMEFCVGVFKKIVTPFIKITGYVSRPVVKMRNILFVKIRVIKRKFDLKCKKILEKVRRLLVQPIFRHKKKAEKKQIADS